MAHRVLYSSNATGTVSDADLEAILEGARRRNPPLGLTGVLLFNGKTFLQVLEGPKETVEKMMERIERDMRHNDIQTILVEHDVEPLFGDWSMAYAPLSPDIEARLKGAGAFSGMEDGDSHSSRIIAKFFRDILKGLAP